MRHRAARFYRVIDAVEGEKTIAFKTYDYFHRHSRSIFWELSSADADSWKGISGTRPLRPLDCWTGVL